MLAACAAVFIIFILPSIMKSNQIEDDDYNMFYSMVYGMQHIVYDSTRQIRDTAKNDMDKCRVCRTDSCPPARSPELEMDRNTWRK